MAAAESMHGIGELLLCSQALESIHQLCVVAVSVKPDDDAVLLHLPAQLGLQSSGDGSE
jgi:hypothetical protein